MARSKQNKVRLVKSLDELKDISTPDGVEAIISLAGGLVGSRKFIKWNPKTKKFWVINYIDDSSQHLTSKQLMSKNYTNIGEALKKGALWYDNNAFNWVNEKLHPRA